MATKKKTIEIRYAGKKNDAALKALNKKYSNLGKNLVNNLPASFYLIMANKVREFFRDNYIAQQDWVFPILSSEYARNKDKYLRRGDSFKVGRLGIRSMSHGSGVFGRRTDTILDAISPGGVAGIVRTDKKNVGKNAIELTLNTGINSSYWDGGNQHINGSSGKRWNQTVENQLLAFSNRISPSGARKSILVKLTPGQKSSVSGYIKNNFKVSAKKVFAKRI